MKLTHHRIDYIEFTVSDMAATKAFYGSVFGWTFNDYGPGYVGIRDGDGELGGFALGEVTPGGPLIVLFSDNLDATEKSIADNGGTIVKAAFEFPGGRRFEFTDPSGNRLAVWSTS